MDIDKNSLYYQHISNRSFLHFIIGLYPRLIQYIKLNKARKKAIKQGANIMREYYYYKRTGLSS